MKLAHGHARLVNALAVAALGVLAASAQAQVTVTGGVFDSLVTQKDLGDATVMIVELGRTTTSDPRGRFRFDSVPAGTYRITFFHAVLDSLELAAPQLPIDVPGAGRIAVRLATPSPATAYARLCPGTREAGTGVAYGRVRDVDDGHAIGGAELRADWVEWLFGGGRPMTRKRAGVTARSSTSGAYVLCGLPLDLAVDVRASALAHETGPLPIQPGAQLLARRDFALSLRDSAARSVTRDSVRGDAADTTGPAGTASLTGIVRGTDGRTFAGAIVSVLGSMATGRSGDDGRFTVKGVPAGTHAVLVRAIGLTPLVMVVGIATAGLLDTVIVLDKRPQMLAAVSITGVADRNDRNGFNDRRRKGYGTFISRAEIAEWDPIDLVDLVTIKPTVRRVWSRDGDTIELRGQFGLHCSPSVFLDGMEMTTTAGWSPDDLKWLVRPKEIIGVEIYTGPMMPVQFDRTIRTRCGSIVMWTR